MSTSEIFSEYFGICYISLERYFTAFLLAFWIKSKQKWLINHKLKNEALFFIFSL